MLLETEEINKTLSNIGHESYFLGNIWNAKPDILSMNIDRILTNNRPSRVGCTHTKFASMMRCEYCRVPLCSRTTGSVQSHLKICWTAHDFLSNVPNSSAFAMICFFPTVYYVIKKKSTKLFNKV